MAANEVREARTAEQAARRLESLLDRADRQGLRSLSDRDVADLGKLYRAVSSWLAQRRAFGGSARRIEELNRLVARGHTVVYGRPPRIAWWRALAWQTLAFPQTVRRTWPYHALAGALLVFGALYGYFGAVLDPDWTLSFTLGSDDRTPYATTAELAATLNHGRDGSVGAEENAMFAAFLWQNNTRVALLAFFLGFAAGVPTILLVVNTGVMLGTYTYTFARHGLGYEWGAWIAAHGVTELLAIVLLAGGGLLMGRCVVAPGEVSRNEALRRVRPDALRLLMFAFPMLLLAALLESFVRQSTLGDGARYLIAGITAVFWIAYLGFVRPPKSMAEQLRPVTAARRGVPLPTDEELFGST